MGLNITEARCTKRKCTKQEEEFPRTNASEKMLVKICAYICTKL